MLLLATSGYQAGGALAMLALAALAIRFGLRVVRLRRHGRVTDAIALAVCAALLVAGIIRFVDRHAAGPWDTQEGRQLHAGFVASCQPSEAAGLSCECIFQYVTRVPLYDTPVGFETLLAPIAATAGGSRALPPVLQEAVASCRVLRTG